MNEDWFGKLRDKMEDYGKSAPEGLWDAIEASLPKKKQAASLSWVWRSVAIAAVLAIGVFTTVRISHRYNAPATIVAQADKDTEGDSKATVKKETAEDVGVVEGTQVKKLLSPSEKYRHEMRKMKEETNIPHNLLSSLNVEDTATERMKDLSEQKLDNLDNTESENEEKAEEAEIRRTEEFLRQAEAEDKAMKKAAHPISVGLSIGSGSTESNSSGVFNTMMFDAGQSPYSRQMDGIATRAVTNDVARENIYDGASHKRPVRMGIMVNYPLSKVFGIESGVNYSTLSSTFTTTSSRTETEDSQKLHYIGIPVNLTANILNTRYFRIYAKAGGMGEKCVSGRVTTSVYDKEAGNVRTSKKDLDVDGLEWSINAAGGLQFNINDFVGIYAEPGVSYHFNSNSNANTIYTDQQFDFAFNFGIRFSLNTH
ncbi:MAG: outer membrane beta-barrel protein [Bacteroidales bacterium]|nr:outer membrane beta-barrel protein [Bacteroidales bacterium]MDY6002426.1 outer membrane beta-barrel protein [Candidatus Cryptobacteroides sp.]